MIGKASRDVPDSGLSPLLVLELQRNVEAPGIARAAMADVSEELRLSGPNFQTLVLLVSEIVSNAVLHSSAPHGSTITLTTSVSLDTVRVSVSDAGGGFVPRERDPESIHDGYGLYLVDKAASRWGVDSTAHTSVWFELPRSV